MSKPKTKAEMLQTFTLHHFVCWVVSSEPFMSQDAARVEQWARQFIQIVKDNLLLQRSMAFTPIGHLVVAKKNQRQLRLPGGKLCESQAGVSVRFRGRPCESGAYVKRGDWVKLLEIAMDGQSKATKLALYDCWIGFLAHAITSKARIELRGLGGFHLHQRDSVHTNLAHIQTKNTDKVYLRFAPSKNLMNALNHKL